MSRQIQVLCVGDSITQGYISGTPAAPGTTFDPVKAWAGQLPALLGSDYSVTNIGIAGSHVAQWMIDNLSRRIVETLPPQPVPGPDGTESLHSWGIVPQMPVDLVLLMGAVNEMLGFATAGVISTAEQAAARHELFAEQLLSVGAGAVMLSCHGVPNFGIDAAARTLWQQQANRVGDIILGLPAFEQNNRMLRGIDGRVVLDPPAGFFEVVEVISGSQDVHPNQVGHDAIATALAARILAVPHRVLSEYTGS